MSSKQDYLNKINELDLGSNQPKTLDSSDFFLVAEERRSVRQYDPTFELSMEEIEEILTIATKAPSSSNLQPWRFLVIQEQELKEKLLPIANNQKQVTDASAVIAVLGDLEAYKKAEDIYGDIVKSGKMTKEVKDFYVSSIYENYSHLSEEQATKVAMVDGGLVSMQLMLAAKAKGLDTVPMGGFKHDEFIKAFHVPETFKPVMLIALGKGTQEGFEKYRLPLNEVVTWNTF